MIIKFVCFVGFVLGVLQVSAAWNPKPFPPEEKPYLNEFNNDYGCTNYDTITPGKSWQTSDGAWISTPEDKRCVQYCRHWKPEEQVKMICYCDTFIWEPELQERKCLVQVTPMRRHSFRPSSFAITKPARIRTALFAQSP